jgi:adenylyl-sulfate kinase
MAEQGFVIWFTGLAASGKSTISSTVEERLRGMGKLVENLDADEVRQNLSPNLGFSEEARDENTKRLAWMGKILGRNGVNALIAAVAPMQAYRDRARDWCPRFVEVYVSCPLEVCKERDPKGLYARAERGEINDIAGWHQPYEAPASPELVIETDKVGLDTAVDMVFAKLEELGYL